MNAVLEPTVAEMPPTIHDIVQSACRRIPPLWPLKNFVAVNPFLGLSDRHFPAAAQLMQQVGHGEMLMSAEYYREQIAGGRIQEKDIRTALTVASKTLPPEWAERMGFASCKALDAALAAAADSSGAERVLSFADYLDLRNNSEWSAFVVEEISKWCSAYFDEGQSSWRMPWRDLGLYAAWKAAAQLDANPELSGLKGFREFVAELPDNPAGFIGDALRQLGVPKESQADFLHRQLMSLPGWSGYVQFRVREQGMGGRTDDSLSQLLAIRLSYDVALYLQHRSDPKLLSGWKSQVERTATGEPSLSGELLARQFAQLALECGYQGDLIAQLKSNPARPSRVGTKTLQAVFCIDVRSEVYRRSLEAQSEEIETIGFAGFFGVAIEYLKFGQAKGGAQCPVLLTPKIKVREGLQKADARMEGALLQKLGVRQTVNGAWNSFKTSAISCFSFVETAGLWFGVKLAKDAMTLGAAESSFAPNVGVRRFAPRITPETCSCETHGHTVETGIPVADQINLAAGMLKNMGLTSNFARVVLICGHGSATANNPYGSALDCGACGGHAGDANARVAAAILNQPEVRQGLKLRNIEIPSETIFIAGLHNTTTDEVLVYDEDHSTGVASADVARVKGWLTAASKRSRRERAASLGLGVTPDSELDGQIFARSRDWAQVRPEWGLANNAAFIAAPREWTKGLNLGGRVFLHNYDASLDADHSVLELILVAPMVVASWINLQYYGSTVNNRLFGSGDKVLHNVVGTFGVWQGNGGDLKPGLPLQSVHDGARWMHEPLRLSVFIEAECSAIEGVLKKHPGVRELIENGWVHLFAIDPSAKQVRRYCGKQFATEVE
jgi:uncharacterized protein YbcC (UPF0753/DUF2309 family)